MNKVAHYLQEHLLGEVMTAVGTRRYFATDTSILTVTPAMVVYPRNEADVRKTARFAWQLAERKRIIPITARGAGTDQTGAALGAGIILAFQAHMNRILELDGKTGTISVEPGANYGKVQQTLKTHGRFLPPFPASFEYSTLGGAVANNAGGEKSLKYGTTREFVRGLRVVLANGEVIETGRLSKKDFSKKLGLVSFEGEVYRALDALLEEQASVLKNYGPDVTKNAAGYCLSQVRKSDGSFDLTPLFVGSQGTLGIVTEIQLETEVFNPAPALFVAQFDNLQQAQQAITELRTLPEGPSAIEMVDDRLLELIDKLNPNQLKDRITKPYPKLTLFVEFDNPERVQKKLLKKAHKVLERCAKVVQLIEDVVEQERYWAIRHSSATVAAHSEGQVKAVPIIEDGIVPPERFNDFMEGIYQIFDRNHLQAAVWGHAGDANVHVQPFLDLAQVGDRQVAFRVMDEYYDLVMSLGGSISGSYGDGRLHAPFLPKFYGPEVYEIFQKVKRIFDPYNILNPGVKIDVTLESIKPLVRASYSIEHLADHLPRS